MSYGPEAADRTGTGAPPTLDDSIFAAVVGQSEDFIAIATAEGKLLFLNPTARTMLAGSAQAAEMRELVDQGHADLFEGEAWPAVLRTGRWIGEIALRQDSGEPMLTHLTLSLVGGEGGATAVAAVARDAARIKRLEAEATALREELARISGYLDEGQRLSRTASWAWNVNTGELYWSREHFRVWGREPSEATQGNFFQTIHPEDRALVTETYERAVRERRPLECRYRIVRPDGEVRHIHALGRPVASANGEIAEIVGTVIDDTERRRAEEALAKAHEDLAQASRVTTVGELTASIAHEINQPLAAIAANANACLRWLAGDPADHGEALAAARRIVADANRASDVIRGIRAFLTRRSATRTAIDVNELALEVIDLIAPEARKAGVAISVRPQAALPPVLADRVQVRQVMVNLATNAIEAMEGIEGRPRALAVSTGYRDGHVHVCLRDTGPGLADRARAFDAFYTTKEEGMGLGLAISRSIVEAHGGRLFAAENEDGVGESFFFTLPADVAESE